MLYSKVLDHDGNVLLDGTGESRTVLKESTAAVLTSAMEDVVNSGTGTACRISNMPVAGKTVLPPITRTSGSADTLHIIPAQYGADMTITKNVATIQISVSVSGRAS